MSNSTSSTTPPRVDEGVKSGLIAMSIVFMVLPVPFVLLRFLARKIRNAAIGIDDYLIIPAALICVVMSGLMLAACTKGNMGQHEQFGPLGVMDPILTPQAKTFLKLEYIIEVFVTSGNTFTKLSILFLYRRIFDSRTFRIITDIEILIMLAWGISFTFGLIFQCHPVDTPWNDLAGEMTNCVQILPFYVATSSTDLITDIMILVLPIPMVWKLQVPTRRKIMLLLIFLLGTFVIVINVIRLQRIFEVTKFLQTSLDFSHERSQDIIWSIAESDVAVICACLPVLRPIFTAIFEKTNGFFSSRGSFSFSKRSSDARSSVVYGMSSYQIDVNQSKSSLARLARGPGGGVTQSTVESITLQEIQSRQTQKQLPKNGIVRHTELYVSEEPA